ncbi:MAG: S1 RNA-binding domain-containing protein [Lentisphaeria bacterium]|nr:S1 RNA-binding domain-containing protein [Lentisphaeria bacterium]
MSEMNGKDFSDVMERGLNQLTTTIRTGAKVKGVITKIGKSTVFVDVGARMDGVIDRKDLENNKGELKYKEGDTVEAFCMGWTDDGIQLTVKMSGDMIDSSVEQAFHDQIPIEGKVTSERKGGFGVQVASVEGFCPISQIDARGVKKEAAEYVGQTFTFLVTEYSEDGRNLVLSRRKLLEQEAEKDRERLKDSLREGDVMTGTVVKVLDFGAFVDLGGIEGLVPVSQMSWARNVKAEDCVKVGDEVQVKIMSIDWGDGSHRERISLSMKQVAGEPWERIAHELGYAPGIKRKGKVTRLADFGAFIELEPGIEGLAHVSQLGQAERVDKPSDVLKEGEEVDVTILAVDFDKRRISLCIGDPIVKEEKPAKLTAEQEREVQEIELLDSGAVLEGKVVRQQPFGVFVELPNGQTGLLHISQTPFARQGAAATRSFYRAYPIGSTLQVVVREASRDRVSLTLAETLESEKESNRTEPMNVKDEGDGDFGSLGDLFGGLKL